MMLTQKMIPTLSFPHLVKSSAIGDLGEYKYLPAATDFCKLIIHKTANWLIVDKPCNILSVPGVREKDCLLSRLKTIYPEAELVHRLDMDTSGLMLFALSKKSQSELSKLFINKQIQKLYIASCYSFNEVRLFDKYKSGFINLPLDKDSTKRPRVKISKQGKDSATRFRILEEFKHNQHSLYRVLLKPITGRTHQLRMHLFAMGYPIVGDKFYFYEAEESIKSELQLRAVKLAFICPFEKKHYKFNCIKSM